MKRFVLFAACALVGVGAAYAWQTVLAYDPITEQVYVSDEAGDKVTVIDAHTTSRAGAIELGGEAGNTVYDPVSHHLFAGVQTRDELAEIDPVISKAAS